MFYSKTLEDYTSHPVGWIYQGNLENGSMVIPGSNRWRYVNVPYFMPYVVGIFPDLGLKNRPYIWIYMVGTSNESDPEIPIFHGHQPRDFGVPKFKQPTFLTYDN